MHPRQHTALLLFAILLAFVWLQVPWLQPLALQGVALATAAYIILKKLNRSKIHQILPQQNSAEMALVTFSLMLLIGHTGTLNSPLFPLTYVHLYFLVMSSDRVTAAIVGPATALYHFSLQPEVSMANIGHLISIPIVLVFFLFAREQHEEVIIEQQTIEQDETLLNEVTQESQALQLTIDQLETEKSEKTQMVDQIHSVLNHVQNQLLEWNQQYFACEPKAQSEVKELFREIDQALDQSATMPGDVDATTK